MNSLQTKIGMVSASLLALAACVREPVKVTIKNRPEGMLTKKDQRSELKVVAYDKDNIIMDVTEPFVWTSGDPAVVTVDSFGNVVATGSGETTVTAKYGKLSDSVDFRVRIIGSVTLNVQEPQVLKMGKTLQLVAKTLDDKGRPYEGPKVRYSSSTHCVDIDADGLLTAQALGECEAYAAVGDRVASVRIKVKE